jgi:hypothetical protein
MWLIVGIVAHLLGFGLLMFTDLGWLWSAVASGLMVWQGVGVFTSGLMD